MTIASKVTFFPSREAIPHSTPGARGMWNHGVDASPPLPLAALEPGVAARVVDVPPADAARLAAEGLHRGDAVVVEDRLPLGGPVVVRLGRARLALARRVAAAILVEPGAPA